MTLAIFSYCGKKSHDAAAPAPKSEAPAGSDTSKTTATTYMQPSCQTADEIDTHVTNAGHKAEAFCFHKVEHPAASLKEGLAIASDMQLKQDLDVAFLNVSKIFADAQTSCASLGAGWHAPLSNNQNATPQAADNSNSLEAMGKYFSGLSYKVAWSSSTVSDLAGWTWIVLFDNGLTGAIKKLNSYGVVCVRP